MSQESEESSPILVLDKSNVMLYNPQLPNLDKEKFGAIQRSSCYDEYFEFMYLNYFPRIFVMDDQATIYIASRRSLSSGRPYEMYNFDQCHKNAASNPNLVPPFERQKSADTKSTLHWIIWCIQHPSYKRMHSKAYDRTLCGLAISPMSASDTPHGSAYLCTYQPPLYIPRGPFSDSTTKRIMSFFFPGTKIPVVPWFLSFLCRVRFRSSPLSFVNYLAMAAYLLDRRGYMARTVWVLTGEQKSGKSLSIQFLLSMLSPAAATITHIDALPGLFKGGFNDLIMKPIRVINEGGHRWRETVEDSAHIRTMISESGPFEVNRKHKDLITLYGASTLIICADRFSKPSKDRGGVSFDRRIVNIRMGDRPDNTAGKALIKNAVHIHDYFFNSGDPSRAEWLNEFKQLFAEYLSQFEEFICATGLDTHALFRPNDYFSTHLAKQIDGESFRLILQRNGQSTTCPDDIRQAANALLTSLACEGTIFPIQHPGCFLNFFHYANLEIFKTADRGILRGDTEYEILRATWLNDRSPWKVTIADVGGKDAREGTETLKELYEEYLVRLHKCMHDSSFRDEAHHPHAQPTDSELLSVTVPPKRAEFEPSRVSRDEVNLQYYKYMLAKFRSCQFIRGCMGFDLPESSWGECFPKRWTRPILLLLMGMWAAFFKNGCTPPGEADNYGSSLRADAKQMTSFCPLVTHHLGLKAGFAGGSNIRYVGIFNNLGMPIRGATGHTYENRPSLAPYGPFRILASLVEESGGEFRPDLKKLDAMVQRAPKLFDDHSDEKIAHATLADCVPAAIVDKINKILDHEELYGTIPENSRLQFEIWDSVFSRDGVALLAREKFDSSLQELLSLCIAGPGSQGDEGGVGRRKRRRLNTQDFIDGDSAVVQIGIAPVSVELARKERERVIANAQAEVEWQKKKDEEGAVEPFESLPPSPNEL